MFYKISNEILNSVLSKNHRQYLVGNLKKKQDLIHIDDENIEIGLTFYDENDIEDTHYHTMVTEYQYVLSGLIKYFDVDEKKEYEFKTGDFYCIKPYTKYAQKAKKGTKILFIKNHSINDKILVNSNIASNWLKEKISTIRIDHSNDCSIHPNSLKPATAVAIIYNNYILLERRKDNSKWTMPGGTIEFGESVEECAVREIFEETGIKMEKSKLNLFKIYSNPNYLIEYSDGEIRQEFTTLFIYFLDNKTNIKLDDESSDYSWVSFDEINKYNFTESQLRRINDVIMKVDKNG